jgi:D-tyrosyl-tRNA(Tyr) deacylase
VQRVISARVSVNDNIVGKIDRGLFVLFGAGINDSKSDVEELVDKLTKLRIMSDKENKMNLSVLDTGSSILVVSQFTLYADTSRGNRPSFIRAKEPKEAEQLYLYFIKLLKGKGICLQTGSFGKYMRIDLELDGPVTIILESSDKR